MPKIKLSDEDRKALEEAEGAMNDAAEAIEKLKALGVDVEGMETMLDEVRLIRDGLLKNF